MINPYILIGGASTRFGRDKATYEFEGEMLASRAVRIAEEAFPSARATFLSTTPGTFLNRRQIADVYPDRGAAGAIHAALADAASDGWIFVLACDLPLATSVFVVKLSEAIDEDHGCVIPVQADGRWQPLCALYHVNRCLQVFEKAIAGEGKHLSLRAIANSLEPRIVEYAEYESLPGSDRLLTNANSIGDLERI